MFHGNIDVCQLSVISLPNFFFNWPIYVLNCSSDFLTHANIFAQFSENTSTSAASAEFISAANIAADAEITVDIDQIGSSTAGAGLKVKLDGYRTA